MASILLFALALSATYASPTPSVTKSVHIVSESNSTWEGDDNGAPAPEYFDIFNLPSALLGSEYIVPDYCKINQTTDKQHPTQLIYRTLLGQNSHRVPLSQKDAGYKFGKWEIGPFEGYVLGPNCTFFGNQGSHGYGRLSCPAIPGGGVDCIDPFRKKHDILERDCVHPEFDPKNGMLVDVYTTVMTLEALCQCRFNSASSRDSSTKLSTPSSPDTCQLSFHCQSAEGLIVDADSLDMVTMLEAIHLTDVPVPMQQMATALKLGGSLAPVIYSFRPIIVDDELARHLWTEIWIDHFEAMFRSEETNGDTSAAKDALHAAI
ncbi:MAG: hypothetical protein Q9159_002799 [Coniocarpon cinnabarinum]